MSFGIGVGDIIRVVELANGIRIRLVDAPDQYKAINDEVRNLSNILDEGKIILPQRNLTDEQKEKFSKIIQGCQNVLNSLKEILEKYQKLGSDPKSCDPEGLRIKIQSGWKRLTWKPEDVKEYRERLTSNVSSLNAFYSGLTLKSVLEIKSDVDRLHERKDDQDRRADFQDNQVIIDWLSKTNYHTQQDDFIKRRQEGTGTWLLNSEKFQEWFKMSRQTLFCPGIPGAGKTMMSSIVVKYLEDEFSNKTNIGVAFLYCNYGQHQEQKAEDLLLSILMQLTEGQSGIPADIKSLYERHRTKKTRPSLDDIVKVLHSAIRSYSRVYMVIDALDEYQDSIVDRKRFLSELFKLQANTEINLFATSRFIPDITKEFRRNVWLEIRASKEDVQRYLYGHMSQLPPCVFTTQGLQEEITAAIINAVDGMFLLAQLYLESLNDKRTPRLIRRALENLPKGSGSLDQAYGKAMEIIQGQKAGFEELAILVLSWIVCAKRPLTTLELQHALAVEVGDLELGDDNFQEIEEVVSVCAGLVTVDKESDIIRLVHYTTQEYFERTRKRWFPNAETVIATTCVTYLSFDAFDSGACSTDEELNARLQSHTLYDYAAKNWGYHVFASITPIEDLTLDLLNNKAKLSAAAQAMMAFKRYPLQSGYRKGANGQFTAVHLAAYFGLEKIMIVLLSERHNPDPNDKREQTPLSWAAKNGHEAVVALLLDKDGVDPDSKDECGRTPLSWAANSGHEAVVKLLLLTKRGVDPEFKDTDHGRTQVFWAAKKKVDPDFSNKNGRTPLSWAAENGHEAVVKLLLAKDAVNFHSRDTDHGRAPLLWAAMYGHKAVVKLLLAKAGIDPNCKDKYGRTPLSWAVENGHESVVKLLLAKDGVDPNSKDTYYGRTPLSRAAINGHEAVVKLLLAKEDIDPDSGDTDDGRTPLSWAAINGQEPVVKLLLVKDGVNPDSKDTSYGQTPLLWAAKNGHEAVVKLLLAMDGVNPDSKDTYYGRTPLFWAAMNGYKAVVELLLAKDGINPDSKDNCGRTPLSWAAENGHEEVAKLLLDKDSVNPNSKDTDFGRTPLFWAANNGHKMVVKLLLALDCVDPNTTDNNSWTSLSLAAKNGHEAVIKLLLAVDGVVLDSKNKFGQTPLSCAATNGHEAVVQLLLAMDGVDPDSTDKDGLTPLSLAAKNEHEAVIKLLLAVDGVVLDSKNKFGQTPLSCAATNGHEAVVQLLLAMDGVDPDSTDKDGLTPLFLAAKNGHEAVIKLLLATDGVDLKSKNKFGQTPLSCAATNGHDAVVGLLLAKHGVGLNLKDKQGQTPLLLAAKKGHTAVVQLLLAKFGVETSSKDTYFGQTPLSWAARNGHRAVVSLMIFDAGVDPDSKDNDYNRTPLSWSAENGHELVVKLLLDNGRVDPDSRDKYGRTPLLWAAENGREEVTKLLLAKDSVNPNSKDTYFGRTPLFWAAMNGHEAVVKLLLAKGGIDPDATDNYGRTPRLLAADNGHELMVKLLEAHSG